MPARLPPGTAARTGCGRTGGAGGTPTGNDAFAADGGKQGDGPPGLLAPAVWAGDGSIGAGHRPQRVKTALALLADILIKGHLPPRPSFYRFWPEKSTLYGCVPELSGNPTAGLLRPRPPLLSLALSPAGKKEIYFSLRRRSRRNEKYTLTGYVPKLQDNCAQLSTILGRIPRIPNPL